MAHLVDAHVLRRTASSRREQMPRDSPTLWHSLCAIDDLPPLASSRPSRCLTSVEPRLPRLPHPGLMHLRQHNPRPGWPSPSARISSAAPPSWSPVSGLWSSVSANFETDPESSRITMKWAFVLLALLPCSWCATAGISTQELLSGVPECARTCLDEAISNSSCKSVDVACLCAQHGQALTPGAACYSMNCSIIDAHTTHNDTNNFCDIAVRDKSPVFINVTIVLGVLSGFVTLLRLGSKVYITKSDFGLDDLFVVLTLVVGIPSSAMNIHGTAAHGEGRDIWTLEPNDVTQFGFYFWILELLYFSQVSLLKMALLFFYLRIFPGPVPQKLLWGTVGFNAAYGVGFVFLAAFQCTPVSYFWTNWDGEHKGTCLNTNSIGWANSSVSIALDVWMLAIPLWQLRSLKLHWKKKIGVAAMFLVGTFVTIVSMVRLQFLVELGASHNPTYDQVNISVWSTVEINIGIICASMPSLRILLVRLFPVLGGSSYAQSRYNNNYGEDYGRRSKIVNRSHALVELPSRGSSPTRPQHGGIEMKRTYNVQYSEGDETRLVHPGDSDRKGRGGTSGTSGASTSEVSL
ncbi:hypothetical protein G7Z17_g11017 [Cylindrodendrum hubeiense]|uniref:CFEM domain-containing protein n=1 Tax=Cylindrodendrum hubeiense TaxID=595255 RepID=A0A9P5L6S0_9HYPO|nr:hypothetical protein G7Z17_g11017 [Cylindrodendrum hubeiense]